MALRGNLRELSLPDIFQLITFSGKTGVLRIRRDDDAQGSVWFREGDVFFAQSNWRSEPLGERLVAAQRITPMALERALELRSKEPEGGRRLGEILVEGGFITDKVLEAFVQEQMQDTIFDLMRWDEGDFEFEALPDGPDEDIGLAVSIENVIMEGSRRLDEWVRIKKKIPSMGIVFKMATAPGEGTFEISLKPTEWNLLLLVDGSRSVAELAEATSRTDFEVARIVYGLFSAGLLEFASDDEIVVLRAEREKREAEEAKRKAAAKPKEKPKRAAVQAPEQEPPPAAAPVEEKPAAKPAKKAGAKPAEPAEPAEEAPPAEVPEFLGAAGAQEATAEDLAALEEAMGAVLGRAEEARPAVAEPPAAPEPPQYTPGEEPAFIAASKGAGGGEGAPVASVEELFADIAELAPPVQEAASEPAVEPQMAQPGPAPDVEFVTQAEESAAVTEEAAEGRAGVGLELAPEAPEASEAEVAEAVEPEVAAELASPAEAPVEYQIVSEVEAVPEADISPPEERGAPAEIAPPVEEPVVEVVPPEEEPASAEVAPPEDALGVQAISEQWAIPDDGTSAETPVQPVGVEVADFEAVLEDETPAQDVSGEPPFPLGEDALIAPELQSVAAALEEEPPAVEESAPPLEPGTFVVVPAASGDAVSAPAGEEDVEIEVEPLSSVVPEVVSAGEPEQGGPSAESAEATVSIPGLAGYDQDLMALGMEGLPSDLSDETAAGMPLPSETGEYEAELTDEELGLEPIVEPMGISGAAAAAEEPGEAEHDFSELLESLDIGAEPGEEPAGVISTDMFLDDLNLDKDLGFHGELTDELSALTGADRPVRPSASVRQIPAEGESTIRRDTRVNRETLMKIIDGIKDL